MATLEQCFEKLTEFKQVQKGDEQYCPYCMDHKLAKKELSIYKAPDILVLRLERFTEIG